MNKKDEYLKAKETIQEYEKNINSNFISEYTCIVCQKNKIIPYHKDIIDPLTQENSMWEDGVVEKITAGYGSCHDMDSYYIGICDECIENLKQKGLIKNFKELKKIIYKEKNE